MTRGSDLHSLHVTFGGREALEHERVGHHTALVPPNAVAQRLTVAGCDGAVDILATAAAVAYRDACLGHRQHLAGLVGVCGYCREKRRRRQACAALHGGEVGGTVERLRRQDALRLPHRRSDLHEVDRQRKQVQRQRRAQRQKQRQQRHRQRQRPRRTQQRQRSSIRHLLGHL